MIIFFTLFHHTFCIFNFLLLSFVCQSCPLIPLTILIYYLNCCVSLIFCPICLQGHLQILQTLSTSHLLGLSFLLLISSISFVLGDVFYIYQIILSYFFYFFNQMYTFHHLIILGSIPFFSHSDIKHLLILSRYGFRLLHNSHLLPLLHLHTFRFVGSQIRQFNFFNSIP